MRRAVFVAVLISLAVSARAQTGGCLPPEMPTIAWLGPESGCSHINERYCARTEFIQFQALSFRPFQPCDRFEWDFDDGTPPSSLRDPVHLFLGNREGAIVTLRVYNEANPGGIFVTALVAFSPPATKLPTIMDFTVTPAVIKPGQRALLSWSVTNARKVRILPLNVDVERLDGTYEVTPLTTTMYYLLALGDGGQAAADAKIVTVIPAPARTRAVRH